MQHKKAGNTGEKFSIPFYDENIVVIKRNKEIVVPLKQFCTNLNINWCGQLQRIKRNPVLNLVLFSAKPIGKTN